MQILPDPTTDARVHAMLVHHDLRVRRALSAVEHAWKCDAHGTRRPMATADYFQYTGPDGAEVVRKTTIVGCGASYSLSEVVGATDVGVLLDLVKLEVALKASLKKADAVLLALATGAEGPPFTDERVLGTEYSVPLIPVGARFAFSLSAPMLVGGGWVRPEGGGLPSWVYSIAIWVGAAVRVP